MVSVCRACISKHETLKMAFCVCFFLLWDCVRNDRAISSGWMTGWSTKMLLHVMFGRLKTEACMVGSGTNGKKRFQCGYSNKAAL